jgi:RNA polymerase sigma-70 factor (ECF subfamily)
MALLQPDPNLLERAQRGDERAFAELVQAYETPVFDYIRRLIRDRGLAEDLTQEVFLCVYQGLPRFAGRCLFTSWLFQVTKNRVFDELRSSRRRPSTDTLENAPEAQTLDSSPEQGEAIAALWHAVGELNLGLRMALLLRDVVGLSYAEIAEVLEIELSTVKWRIYRARTLVQAALTRKGHTFGPSLPRRAPEPQPAHQLLVAEQPAPAVNRR